MVHFVIGPERAAQVARGFARFLDLAAEHAGLHVPALVGAPVVVHAQHGRLAVEEGTLDPGQHHARVLLVEVPDQAQCMEGTPRFAGLVGGEHAVFGPAQIRH